MTMSNIGSQQQEDTTDIKMSESSLQSIPIPMPPFNPSTFDPYTINKSQIKYDAVDSRELKDLFGEALFLFFKPDRKHGQYHISLFLMSENPEHYTWKGAIDLIEKLFNSHPDRGSPKLLLDFLSGVNPRSRGGYAVSCTYSFSFSIENPSGTLELYYRINTYMANNKRICNYIGADKKNSRCHFYTNKNQIYKNKYLLFNIPLNITGLGIYNKQNSVKATEFILLHVAKTANVDSIRWQRAKSPQTSLFRETIELETLDPIRDQTNKIAKEFEVKFNTLGYIFNRTIKVIKRGSRPNQLDTYKIYDPDNLETDFMRRRIEYIQDKDDIKQQQQQQRMNVANARFVANRRDMLGDNNNNNYHNHNHNNNNNNTSQQQSSISPPNPADIGGMDL